MVGGEHYTTNGTLLKPKGESVYKFVLKLIETPTNKKVYYEYMTRTLLK